MQQLPQFRNMLFTFLTIDRSAAPEPSNSVLNSVSETFACMPLHESWYLTLDRNQEQGFLHGENAPLLLGGEEDEERAVVAGGGREARLPHRALRCQLLELHPRTSRWCIGDGTLGFQLNFTRFECFDVTISVFLLILMYILDKLQAWRGAARAADWGGWTTCDRTSRGAVSPSRKRTSSLLSTKHSATGDSDEQRYMPWPDLQLQFIVCYYFE